MCSNVYRVRSWGRFSVAWRRYDGFRNVSVYWPRLGTSERHFVSVRWRFVWGYWFLSIYTG